MENLVFYTRVLQVLPQRPRAVVTAFTGSCQDQGQPLLKGEQKELCILQVTRSTQFLFLFSKHLFVLPLAFTTNLFRGGNSFAWCGMPQRKHKLFLLFSSSWMQVIICTTVPWHPAMSINLFKRRFDLNTSSLNHVSTQAYTSLLSMKLIVVKRTKHVLSLPYTDLSNNECWYKGRLQKIWQTWNLLVCFFFFFLQITSRALNMNYNLLLCVGRMKSLAELK